MADDIVTRLRIKDGVYTEFWQQKLMDEAADEIERLRTALALACGELSTTGHHYNDHPEPLMQQFLKEAHNG